MQWDEKKLLISDLSIRRNSVLFLSIGLYAVGADAGYVGSAPKAPYYHFIRSRLQTSDFRLQMQNEDRCKPII
jgi:hypothetical protein